MSISKKMIEKPEIEYVDFNEVFDNGNEEAQQKAAELLSKVHKGIYQKTFPIPSEQESLEDWVERLEMGTEKGLQLFSAFGKNLDSDNPEIMGFIVTSYYQGTGVGLIDYVIREKEYKGILEGKSLCEHHEKLLENLSMKVDNKELKGILWEANDPAKIDWNENNPNRFEVDCMAPQKRVDHIEKKFGCKLLGFDYVQAPLEECLNQEEIEEGSCKELLLYSYNAEKYKNLSASDLKNYVIMFSQALNGAENPKDLNDSDITKMMLQLEMMEVRNMPLLKHLQTPEQIESLSACNDNVPEMKSSEEIKEIANRVRGKLPKSSEASASQNRENVVEISPIVGKVVGDGTKR